jgi:hypothetical protein
MVRLNFPPHFEVTIEVNGQPLPEYDVPQDNGYTPKPKEVIKYVVAPSSGEFSIKARATSPYTVGQHYTKGYHDIVTTLKFDGREISLDVLRQFELWDGLIIDNVANQDEKGGTWHQRKFEFAKLTPSMIFNPPWRCTLTPIGPSEDAPKDRQMAKRFNSLGTISLSFRRGKRGSSGNASRTNRSIVISKDDLFEKDLKGQALSVQTG